MGLKRKGDAALPANVLPRASQEISNLQRNLPSLTVVCLLVQLIAHGSVTQPRAPNSPPRPSSGGAPESNTRDQNSSSFATQTPTDQPLLPPQPFGTSSSLPASHTHPLLTHYHV